jgi:hypothetical protein
MDKCVYCGLQMVRDVPLRMCSGCSSVFDLHPELLRAISRIVNLAIKSHKMYGHDLVIK